MGQVRVVSDSGSDLDPKGSHGVTLVPLSVHFGSTVFLDGIDLTADEFYDKLASSEDLPRTSQPTPADFERVYRALVADGATSILSYHLSSKLSGTLQSAVLAARSVQNVPIEVIDTRSASMGIGLVATEAARLARDGVEPEAIIRHTRDLIGRLRIAFVVDTLTYLAKNGRIGRAQAWAGGLLHVKPLLAIEDGVVTPVERIRGRRKALERLVETVGTAIQGRPYRAVILHAAAPDRAETLRNMLDERFPNGDLSSVGLGPTVGTHAGPGTLGVVVVDR